jgi:hypothetical protein
MHIPEQAAVELAQERVKKAIGAIDEAHTQFRQAVFWSGAQKIVFCSAGVERKSKK